MIRVQSGKSEKLEIVGHKRYCNMRDIANINSPGQRIGHIESYNLTSHKKLEITLVFSIVDAIFGEKSTINTTSCNSQTLW